MYKHNERQTILPDEFLLPFGGKLNPENRWGKLAQSLSKKRLRGVVAAPRAA